LKVYFKFLPKNFILNIKIKSIPLRRYGQISEFAKIAVFLGSGANTYLTGQSIVVDGGMVKAL
jgi:3-oxoacyl-[acyl-carrier protein] reductase